MLRDGGNAVDAAVACVLMSWVAESPLTGPGAGGFMLVHTAGGEDHLLDFFVAAPGTRAATSREPADADADRHPLLRGRGPALQRRARPRAAPTATRSAWRRRSSASAALALGDLTARPGRGGARGGRGRADAGLPVRDPRADLPLDPRVLRALRARAATCCARATASASPELGDLLERLGAEGPGFLYSRRRRRRRAATGCSSAAACSRARTWPPTRWSSASRRG